ncbi:MAG TPA: hypothetical protein VK558_12470 [Patescibacteria group bacterium]|nr:hypothetical protein [Patescibacteria group bacterium]
MGGRARLRSLCLALWLFAPPALAAEDAAVAALQQVVGGDFDGDVMSRRDKVAFTDAKTPAVGDCSCTLRRDSWDLDEDLVVVSAWQLVDIRRLSPSQETARVRFHVVAKASRPSAEASHGILSRLQRITLPEEPFDQTVTYKIRLRDGQWRLIDPPRPRVALAPLLTRLRGALAFRTDEAARAKQQNAPRREKMAQLYGAYLQFQIAELEYAALSITPP